MPFASQADKLLRLARPRDHPPGSCAPLKLYLLLPNMEYRRAKNPAQLGREESWPLLTHIGKQSCECNRSATLDYERAPRADVLFFVNPLIEPLLQCHQRARKNARPDRKVEVPSVNARIAEPRALTTWRQH